MLYTSSAVCDQHLTLHLLWLLGSFYSFRTFSFQSNVSSSKISGWLVVKEWEEEGSVNSQLDHRHPK